MISIAVINRCSVLSDGAVEEFVAALQIQAGRDFCSAWSMETPIVQFRAAKPGDWQLVFLDNTDQADDLGYHELSSDYMPMGRVFVKTTQSYGIDWHVPASHEFLEMMGDPDVRRMIALPDGSRTPVEVCDPVSDYAHCYQINGLSVSNFVLPSYFRGDATGPYDFLKLLSQPAPAMSPGGYMDIQKPGSSSWTPIFGAEVPDPDRVRNRHLLRDKPRDQWRPSTAV